MRPFRIELKKIFSSKTIYLLLFCLVLTAGCSVKKAPIYTVIFDFGYNEYTETATSNGGTISAPDKPLRFGHTFDGWWYMDGDEERLWNFETDTVSKDLTLKAKWKEEKATPYTLTLDAKGGECDITSYEVYVGKQYSLPIPIKEGYYFDGWHILGGDDVTEGVWKIAYNYTVYAKWTAYPPGMTVKIGRFEQDNNLTNGPEDIEWYVIDYKDGKYFLFSKYILTGGSFTDQNTKKWETSILREWMNGEFYESVFTDEEREFICKTYLEDMKVNDKVFALSTDELRNIVISQDIKLGFKTEYTDSHGELGAAMIDYIDVYSYHTRDGFIMSANSIIGGTGFNFEGVRPGIWINEEYLNFENN